MAKLWKIVPLSPGQLLDVDPADILENGVYRKCDTYRGGGGYDHLPKIAEQRRFKRYHKQFVVQLHGCDLDCPYCYVTREGVWGKPVHRTSGQMVKAFLASGQDTFHLMGGAPALQLAHWPELIEQLLDRSDLLSNPPLFHSDFTLTEQVYDVEVLRKINKFWPYCLFAVNVKGVTTQQWKENTRKEPQWERFSDNLRRLVDYGIPFYITFTGLDEESQELFWHLYGGKLGWQLDWQRKWAYNIELIDYEAMPHVDDVPWGVQRSG